MDTIMLSTVAQLSNQDLLARVKHLAGEEREVMAVLVAHLAELDQRRLYLAEGYSSLFSYCTQMLHLSEHAAYDRIQAARASRTLPVILEMLSDGSVTLSTVCLLAPHLTPENYQDVLDVIRKLPTRAPVPHHAPALSNTPMEDTAGSLPDGDAQPLLAATPTAAAVAPLPVHRAVITPLAPQRYKVQFTASAELHEKIRQAQALLRHQIPDGDLSKVFDRALTVLLQDLIKKKLAATDRPRASREASHVSRRIPASVRRTVWSRDERRCALVADNGRRCTEEAFLELHHVVPHALGGPATVENIQLRCRAHNGSEAERDFGSHASLVVREPRASYAHVVRPRPTSFRKSAQLRPGRVHGRARLYAHVNVKRLVDGFLQPTRAGAST